MGMTTDEPYFKPRLQVINEAQIHAATSKRSNPPIFSSAWSTTSGTRPAPLSDDTVKALDEMQAGWK